MKKLLVLTFMVTVLGCSSTENIKIVSPSTPEKEAKEEIRQAPITRLGTSSQPPARHETKEPPEAAEENQKADNIKIVSPSTPEKEVKEEIRSAPVTRLETSSQPPVRHETKESPEAVAESPTASSAPVPEQAFSSSASIKSPYTLEALINLLEKKGVIHEGELVQEIRKLEMKETK